MKEKSLLSSCRGTAGYAGNADVEEKETEWIWQNRLFWWGQFYGSVFDLD